VKTTTTVVVVSTENDVSSQNYVHKPRVCCWRRKKVFHRKVGILWEAMMGSSMGQYVEMIILGVMLSSTRILAFHVADGKPVELVIIGSWVPYQRLSILLPYQKRFR
jgi:hypothetical protein